jgi:EAL domain-containing protein (putative c-di-GMP-specific phosphodiesterase class I)
MAVNISAMEFRHDNFLETVFAILEETGLDPKSTVRKPGNARRLRENRECL